MKKININSKEKYTPSIDIWTIVDGAWNGSLKMAEIHFGHSPASRSFYLVSHERMSPWYFILIACSLITDNSTEQLFKKSKLFLYERKLSDFLPSCGRLVNLVFSATRWPNARFICFQHCVMIPRWSKKWVAGLEWNKKARGCWVCLRPVDCQRPWISAFHHLTNLWERLIHSSFLLHHLRDLHNTSWHHESSTQSHAKTHTRALVMLTIISEDKRKVCWWVYDLFYKGGGGKQKLVAQQ